MSTTTNQTTNSVLTVVTEAKKPITLDEIIEKVQDTSEDISSRSIKSAIWTLLNSERIEVTSSYTFRLPPERKKTNRK